jgi:hypothetical protein
MADTESKISDCSHLLTRKQAAAFLQKLKCSISANTLANLLHKNGPPFYMDGGRALYDPVELEEWRRNRLVRREL